MAKHITKRQARDLFRAAKLNEQQMYPAAQRHHDEHGTWPGGLPTGTARDRPCLRAVRGRRDLLPA